MRPESKNISGKIPAIENARDRDAKRAYAFFVGLKQYFYNGCIYNFKSKRQQIGADMAIHENTVRYLERAIILRGWAVYEGKNLHLRSYTKVWASMGLTKKRFYKTQFVTYKYNISLIDAVPVYESIRKQNHAIKENIFNLELNNLKACDQFNIPNERLAAYLKTTRVRAANERPYRRMLKKYWKANEGKLLAQYEAQYYKAMHSGLDDCDIITPFPVLSMRSLAYKITGSTSTGSGHAIKARLMEWGLIDCKSDLLATAGHVKKMPAHRQPSWLIGGFRQCTTRINFAN